MTVAAFLERVYTSASSSTLKDLWQNLDRNGEIFRHICTHEGVPEDGPLDFGHGFKLSENYGILATVQELKSILLDSLSTICDK